MGNKRNFQENNLSCRPQRIIYISAVFGRRFLTKLFCLLCLVAFATGVFAQHKAITETFETATKKGRYPEGEVTTINGKWLFKDALVWDKEPTDFRAMAPRVMSAPTIEDESGSITSLFETKGLKSVKVGFIGYKLDPGYFQLEVLVSANKGQSWRSIGTARGRYDKSRETFATFKTNSKKDEELMIKVVNTSAPKLNRLNRVNITLIEMEIQ